ncbi:hypothetical protein E2542_SST26646 [Spatholobus suberectus]|nr:hypothetical protein E2542_SST26646 [Spatholobus suberectus]
MGGLAPGVLFGFNLGFGGWMQSFLLVARRFRQCKDSETRVWLRWFCLWFMLAWVCITVLLGWSRFDFFVW